MKTPANTEEVESNLVFIDDGKPWHLGERCLNGVVKYPDGREEPVGEIIFDYDRKAKVPVYSARDAYGNELFAPTHSLPELKKKFVIHKEQLIALAKAAREERGLDPTYTRVGTSPQPTIPAAEKQPSPYAKEVAKKPARKEKIRSAQLKKLRKTKERAKQKSRTR